MPHTETRGRRPDIVLLHGWGMRPSIWDEVVADLDGHFAIHAPDLPGYSDSREVDPYTFDEVTDALATASPQRVTLCGWSLGGQIALAWTLRYPERVERLVLIASTPCFVARSGWEHGMTAAALDEFEQDLNKDPRAMLQRFLALQTRGDAGGRALLRTLRDRTAAQSSAKVLRSGLDLLRQTDLRPNLKRIVQPVLILQGDCDAVVPLAAGAYLQHELPNATFDVLSGAGHAPLVSHSHHVARRIVEFCNER